MTSLDHLESVLAAYLKDATNYPVVHPGYIQTGLGIPIMSSNWYTYIGT